MGTPQCTWGGVETWKKYGLHEYLTSSFSIPNFKISTLKKIRLFKTT